MKKILFLLLIPLLCFSQNSDGIKICLALQSNNFTTDAEAESALTRIIDASGLAKNFALIPCDNISNAVAVSYKGERYIIYDKKFMSLISSRTNDWSNLTILAHEVGHHLNGHSIDLSMAKIVEPKSLAEKRKQELEADEFAGFIMAKLGAPLSSVLSSISLITTDDDDTYSTHPKRSKRLQRLSVGFNKGNKVKLSSSISNNNSNKTFPENNHIQSDLKNSETYQFKLSGKIFGKKDLLPGALIKVKGRNIETRADFDGNYSIIVTVGEIIEFSYGNLETLMIKVPPNNKIINARLLRRYSWAENKEGVMKSEWEFNL